MQTCYRHTDRETGVSCSNCGRPICPDCMTPTPVGMRCPECSKQKTKVHNLRSAGGDPLVTWVLLGLNVLMYFGSKGGNLFSSGGTQAYFDLSLVPVLAGEEPWRMITSGFLHANVLHIFLNMYMLWILGPELERTLGKGRFLALYLLSIVGGSMLVVAFSAAPDDIARLLRAGETTQTVGASGAIFGLFGGAYMYYRARGEHMMTSYLGPTILINLAFTLLIPFISIGGHLGGLLAGGIAGVLYGWAARKRMKAPPQIAIVVVLAVVLFGLGVAVAPSLL
jgi:membrane associated rhomboid family serine protease